MPADFFEEDMLLKEGKEKSVKPGSPEEKHPFPSHSLLSTFRPWLASAVT